MTEEATDTIRRMPGPRIEKVQLNGQWQGWEYEAQLNVSFEALANVASGDFERMLGGLSEIVRSWNFVDYEGELLPDPSPDEIRKLPWDLVTAMATAYEKRVRQLPPN